MTKYFNEPEIKVTKFASVDVITTSGYLDNETGSEIEDWRYGNITGGLDGDIPL